MDHIALADLSAYLDGEMTTEELSAAGEHLRGCQMCRDELDELAAVKSAMAALPSPLPTQAEREIWRSAVRQTLGGARVIPLRSRIAPLPLTLAAAGMLALLLGVGLVSLRHSPAPPPSSTALQVPPVSGLTSTLASPTLVAKCEPRAEAGGRAISGSDDLSILMKEVGNPCAGLHRVDAGLHQKDFTTRLARGLPGLDACLQPVYESTDAPLLPVYATGASYQGQSAVVVVFYTNFSSPNPGGDDLLDTRQAQVFRTPPDCTFITAAAALR